MHILLYMLRTIAHYIETAQGECLAFRTDSFTAVMKCSSVCLRLILFNGN